ncbi:hypothetical protein CO172_01045 [Candidatus Uhrbacteria bacterium CG_4_9_14_3_um_filter_36_7]|uniref:Uncharacterized protein n=1 Tax=Candidatus Uhrbacteria bacterium CG_4_9_14_3_um_filter_36_7 TaxID=1975033 RepID=A0A2M7XI08_9BACT|nr:MAG: hypothetical protein CO172_01045 [Candidatus Uhrbacteria bacterium CG_4_9_14_3_um_filter_36_7]
MTASFLRKTAREQEGKNFSFESSQKSTFNKETIEQEREIREKEKKEPTQPESSQGKSKDVLKEEVLKKAQIGSMPVGSFSTTKDPLTQEIESILEENITDLFLKMNPQEQRIFKEKGEETASRIRALVSGTKINAYKILSFIRQWLQLIPGVNRFFLEQEAKIKTDKIIASKK